MAPVSRSHVPRELIFQSCGTKRRRFQMADLFRWPERESRSTRLYQHHDFIRKK